MDQSAAAMPTSDFEDPKASLFRLFGKMGGARCGCPGLLTPLWRDAAGPVADRTRVRGVSDGVLLVEVEKSFLPPVRQAHDLLVERLNLKLGPYHRIRSIQLTELPEKSDQTELPFVRTSSLRSGNSKVRQHRAAR